MTQTQKTFHFLFLSISWVVLFVETVKFFFLVGVAVIPGSGSPMDRVASGIMLFFALISLSCMVLSGLSLFMLRRGKMVFGILALPPSIVTFLSLVRAAHLFLQ